MTGALQGHDVLSTQATGVIEGPQPPQPTSPTARHSLSQPVVLRGEAPPAVPLVERHQPPVDRLEQLQGPTLGVLCRVSNGESHGLGATQDWRGREHSRVSFRHPSVPARTSPPSGCTWHGTKRIKRPHGYILRNCGTWESLRHNHSCCFPLGCHLKNLLIKGAQCWTTGNVSGGRL